MFPKEVYVSRRENLRNLLGSGVIIFPSYPQRVLSNDTHYKFRQQTDFLYFTGYPEPQSAAIIEFNDNNEIIYHLFVLKKDPIKEQREGRRIGLENAKSLFKPNIVLILSVSIWFNILILKSLLRISKSLPFG